MHLKALEIVVSNDVRVPVPKVANNSDILSRYGHIMQAPGVTFNHAHSDGHVVLRIERSVMRIPASTLSRRHLSIEVLTGVDAGISKLKSGITHYGFVYPFNLR